MVGVFFTRFALVVVRRADRLDRVVHQSPGAAELGADDGEQVVDVVQRGLGGRDRQQAQAVHVGAQRHVRGDGGVEAGLGGGEHGLGQGGHRVVLASGFDGGTLGHT